MHEELVPTCSFGEEQVSGFPPVGLASDCPYRALAERPTYLAEPHRLVLSQDSLMLSDRFVDPRDIPNEDVVIGGRHARQGLARPNTAKSRRSACAICAHQRTGSLVQATQRRPASAPALNLAQVRRALWIDVRGFDRSSRTYLVDVQPPYDRSAREAEIRQAVERLWPESRSVGYSGGVAEFELPCGVATAHFGAVRNDAQVLDIKMLQGDLEMGTGCDTPAFSSALSDPGKVVCLVVSYLGRHRQPFHVLMTFSDGSPCFSEAMRMHKGLLARRGLVWLGKLGKTIGHERLRDLNAKSKQGWRPTFTSSPAKAARRQRIAG